MVIGLGLMYQKTCRTNGRGPERYKKCAPGTKGGIVQVVVSMVKVGSKLTDKGIQY